MQQPKSTATSPGKEAEAGAIILDLERCTVTAQDLDLIPVRINPAPVSPDLAVKHMGIIARHVYTWHQFLPVNVRSFYDTEDMIADVALHVHSIMLRYQPAKAREVTWVYKVAHNSCRDIVQRYQRKMRNAPTVDVEEPAIAGYLSQPNDQEPERHIAESKVEVQALIDYAVDYGSEAQRDLIDYLLHGRSHRPGDLPNVQDLIDCLRGKLPDDTVLSGHVDLPKYMQAIKELREGIRRRKATAEHFTLARKYHV